MVAHHRVSCGVLSFHRHVGVELGYGAHFAQTPHARHHVPSGGKAVLGLTNGTGPELRLGYPLNLSI